MGWLLKVTRDNKVKIILNENFVLYYNCGRLFKIEKPLDHIYVNILDDRTHNWYKNEQRHRDDGPASIYPSGAMTWLKDGLIHRDIEKGPAIILSPINGSKCRCQYWENGEFIKFGESNVK